MAFGLKVAPKHFQKLVNAIFKELIESGDIIVYMDDILIAAETIDQHLAVS